MNTEFKKMVLTGLVSFPVLLWISCTTEISPTADTPSDGVNAKKPKRTEASDRKNQKVKKAKSKDSAQAGNKPVTKTRLKKGKQIYISTCAPCHGRKGRGDGPAAAGLESETEELPEKWGSMDEEKVQ